MGKINVDIMPPEHWQDFEKLTLDWARKKWGDPYAQAHGRTGQAQAGVDVYGNNRSYNGEHTGVQCKKRTSRNKPGGDTPSSTLTSAEIDREIALARTFKPSLDHFVIATTGPRDARLQEHVRVHNLNQVKPVVSLMFWDDFAGYLNDDADLMSRFYSDVVQRRNEYNREEHYYHLVQMAFDRPAIRTTLHSENAGTDFIDALSHTAEAITTGVLKDRDKHIIDHALVPRPLPKQLKEAKAKLHKARILATNALADGRIIQHPYCLEITDRTLISDIDRLRSEAVDLVNQVLQANNMECVSKD